MKLVLLVIALCLAIASANYPNKHNRQYRTKKEVDRLANDLNNDLNDDNDWSFDEDNSNADNDFDSDEDDYQIQMRPSQRQTTRGSRGGRHNQCPNGNCGRVKWLPKDEDEDSYNSNDDDESTEQKPKQHDRRKYGYKDEEPEKPCQPDFNILQKMDQINLHLAARLYQEAKQLDDEKNTVVSPISVQLGLAAVGQGARGNTKKQINQILNLGPNTSKTQNRNAYMALVKTLKGQGPGQGSKQVQIKSSTNIILSQDSAQDQFIESIKTCFDGEVKRCDFYTQPQKCRQQINDFISSKTDKKLQSPLSTNSVCQNTKMIGVNTIQMKANWGKQVQKKAKAGQGEFYPLGEKKAVAVKTIQLEGEFNYYEDNQLKVVGVQTEEKQLTVYLILPKRQHGLNKLEKQRLQYGKQLEKLMDDCDSKHQTLKIQLPYFQIMHKLDSKDILRKLGIEDAFDFDDADFSGIFDKEQDQDEEQLLKHGKRKTGGLEDVTTKKSQKSRDQKSHYLHLNKLIQQASIQLNENGIDAANVHNKLHQGAQLHKDDEKEHEEWGKSEESEFKIDHAFAFLIKHNPTGQLLLAGRVIDPTENVNENENGKEYEEE